jgi:glycosyltransferase involved in cell wall biosynthesis
MVKTSKHPASRKVVLSHDWLIGMRGGERVIEILCNMFPDARIYTLLHNPEAISSTINAHDIHTSWLQKIAPVRKNHRYFLPLYPNAIEQLKISDADLVISTSHCVAKGILPPAGAVHICYCFTPMRYAWTFYEEYFGNSPVKAILAKPVLAAMRRWDRKASKRVDQFVAISKHVQTRIKNFYDRNSEIVYPPVDTLKYTPDGKTEDFDLIVSAMVPYKRLDLAVRAYNRSGYPLKIVGTGSDAVSLKAMAKNNIEFLDWQTDKRILELYRSCRMLIFPGEEDFGIVPLEAQACGRPVVAYGKGGALETIKEGVSGIFFREQTEQSLLDAIEKCAGTSWNQELIRANAEEFNIANFRKHLTDIIEKVMAQG